MALTAQQERFCHEYLVDLNGSAAYRRVYPKVKSEKVARTNAARLLANAGVAARVAELQRAQLARVDVTADRVLRELAFVAFQRANQPYRDDGTLKAPHEWDEATAATIAGVEMDEEVEVVDAKDEQDPQPHGGSLKRKRGSKVLVRVNKVKRWDKVKALELFMKHFGLLKEDAPHPDRFQFNIAALTDEQKRLLLTALRSAALPAAGSPALPAG